jgi:hypothetical protein
MKTGPILAIMSIWASAQVSASSPAAWEALDRMSAKACIAKSGLHQARVGPATRFSDQMLIDVRTVTGRYPQKHMKGAAARMLCAFNRKTQRAEVQELN